MNRPRTRACARTRVIGDVVVGDKRRVPVAADLTAIIRLVILPARAKDSFMRARSRRRRRAASTRITKRNIYATIHAHACEYKTRALVEYAKRLHNAIHFINDVS